MSRLDLLEVEPNIHFQSDITYSFVYWKHRPENNAHLLQAVAKADLIACELGAVNVENPPDTRSMTISEALSGYTQALNAVLNGTAPPEWIAEIANEAAQTQDIVPVISHAFAGSGKRIAFVDAYQHSGDPKHSTQASEEQIRSWTSHQSPTELLAHAYQAARWLYSREIIALGQLAELGSSVHPGATIAIPYGRQHTFLSVAAHQLGATVERTFIGGKPTYFSGDAMLIRAIRAGKTSPEELEQLAVAVFWASKALSRLFDRAPELQAQLSGRYLPLLETVPQLDAQLGFLLSRDQDKPSKMLTTLQRYAESGSDSKNHSVLATWQTNRQQRAITQLVQQVIAKS